MVVRRGYPCEAHSFVNPDRYILEMHRIPGSPRSPPRKGKRVAYLQHGLLDSSAGWVMMGPGISLGTTTYHKINFSYQTSLLI